MHRFLGASRLSGVVTRLARPAGAVAAGLLVVASISAAQATSTSMLKPTADTWANSQSPAANYGGSLSLRADGSPVDTAYLRFDAESLGGTISRAILRLYPNSSNGGGLSVHAVASKTWTESGLTWSNAPAMSTARVSSGAIVAGTVVNIDVTSLVSSSSINLGLTDNDSQAINIASGQSTHPPLLVVTVGTTATSTPVRTLTPSATPVATLVATAVPTATPAPTSPTGTPPTSGPTSSNPLRAAFYYPWFPLAWTQQGIYPFTHYHPSLGFYDGGQSSVVAEQIQAMLYGKIHLGIASWWGQGSQTDDKMPMLLSTAAGTGFQWSIYYEPEGSGDPSSAQIANDLTYINSHYGSDPSFYRIDGRPVIFVYAQPADACAMADRWAAANAGHAAFVVLKVFPGYLSCAHQPDSWHQYSPAVAEDHQSGFSYTISPGFWLATSGNARLSRDPSRWVQNIRDMVASYEPWQLVTTFNEWGEGTAVESATEWASASGYGLYLDALHDN